MGASSIFVATETTEKAYLTRLTYYERIPRCLCRAVASSERTPKLAGVG